MPQEGEFGNDTWGNESWKIAGDLGSWNPMTADEQLGYVYIPLSAPTASSYGGWRPGANLYSEAWSRSTRRPASACGTTR